MTGAAMRLLILLALGVMLQACSNGGESPEEAVRALIASAADAAERRSSADLVEMMHEDYRDQQGHDKNQAAGLLRAYFFQHKNIHLLTRIDEIEWLDDERAVVRLHVAMAGSVISDIDALASLRARIYRFEVSLIRQGEWRVQRASWKRANLLDLQ